MPLPLVKDPVHVDRDLSNTYIVSTKYSGLEMLIEIVNTESIKNMKVAPIMCMVVSEDEAVNVMQVSSSLSPNDGRFTTSAGFAADLCVKSAQPGTGNIIEK